MNETDASAVSEMSHDFLQSGQLLAQTVVASGAYKLNGRNAIGRHTIWATGFNTHIYCSSFRMWISVWVAGKTVRSIVNI